MSAHDHSPSKVFLSLKKGMKKITPPAPVITILLSILVSTINTFRNPEFPHQSPIGKPTIDSGRLENRTIVLINININKNGAN